MQSKSVWGILIARWKDNETEVDIATTKTVVTKENVFRSCVRFRSNTFGTNLSVVSVPSGYCEIKLNRTDP